MTRFYLKIYGTTNYTLGLGYVVGVEGVGKVKSISYLSTVAYNNATRGPNTLELRFADQKTTTSNIAMIYMAANNSLSDNQSILISLDCEYKQEVIKLWPQPDKITGTATFSLVGPHGYVFATKTITGTAT